MEAQSPPRSTSRGAPQLLGVLIPPRVFGGAVAVVGTSVPDIDVPDSPSDGTLVEVDLRVAA